MIQRINIWAVLAVVALFLSIVVAMLVMVAQSAEANPSSFMRKQTAPATTTKAYLVTGTATSTGTTLDSTTGNTFALDQTAVLLLQLTGSSTPFNNVTYATTTYRVDIEYSQDGVDFYRPSATSTLFAKVGPHGAYFTLGTTSMSGAPVATSTPTNILIEVPVFTRFMRPVISLPPGSSNGAVWSEWVATKEQ